ncbi:MAG: CRISPR-associated protein Cas4 [Desulfotomaculaceae bacterium]|nr:CRISPR-associated protein Cas4 [Desulfotomaculaceae bacterium]
MINQYSEDDYLLLSGIQHMAFCERQWALIHIEQAWAENVRTIEGSYLHERTDNPFEDETRKDIRSLRAMPVVSKKLGLSGIADVVEFIRTGEELAGITVRLKGRKGWWRPYPVEYKRGRPKPDDRDVVQLCAQAIALEEMMGVSINSGFLYYGQTRHRVEVHLDQELRAHVEQLAGRMHKMMAEGKTPKAKKGKHCSLCSMKEICQPDLTIRHRPVNGYLERMVDLEAEDY